MTTQFDSGTFENDYIIATLLHMITDLKTEKACEQIIDHYAVELTAFMNGRIIEAVRNVARNTETEQHLANYRAGFLYPHSQGSEKEAGFEFANAKTEEYRKKWWDILKSRLTPNEEKR